MMQLLSSLFGTKICKQVVAPHKRSRTWVILGLMSSPLLVLHFCFAQRFRDIAPGPASSSLTGCWTQPPKLGSRIHNLEFFENAWNVNGHSRIGFWTFWEKWMEVVSSICHPWHESSTDDLRFQPMTIKVYLQHKNCPPMDHVNVPNDFPCDAW